jgi:hypothetical protein
MELHEILSYFAQKLNQRVAWKMNQVTIVDCGEIGRRVASQAIQHGRTLALCRPVPGDKRDAPPTWGYKLRRDTRQ